MRLQAMVLLFCSWLTLGHSGTLWNLAVLLRVGGGYVDEAG